MPSDDAPQPDPAAYACTCEACLRDGLHEPDCSVHGQSSSSECDCGRKEQSEGAG